MLAFDLVMDLLADNKVESGDYFIKQQLKINGHFRQILPFECLKLALLFILRY